MTNQERNDKTISLFRKWGFEVQEPMWELDGTLSVMVEDDIVDHFAANLRSVGCVVNLVDWSDDEDFPIDTEFRIKFPS